ncbi:MAG TPA: HEPN family nuclease [Bryobacteraceae bacterium]|nr:HEPN family nuclease [Bryobacteraceae bacterium]
MSEFPEPYEREFAQRTLANLRLIEAEAKADPGAAFEVTQLICSLLGVLVMTKERSLHRDWRDMPLTDPRASWIPTPKCVQGTPCQTVGAALRVLRNGVAHFNVEFVNEGGEIVGVNLWNINPDTKKTTHRVCLEAKELRAFAERCPSLMEEPPAKVILEES